MNISTIEEEYEYRMKHILKKFYSENELELPKDGNDLEIMVSRYPKLFTSLILDDIEIWMGLDEMAKALHGN